VALQHRGAVEFSSPPAPGPGAGWDPHIEDDDPGYYAIPAVDLVASIAGDYDPQALLFWLPNEHMYGTWDSGHLELLVFPDTTWTDIAAAPERYVTAQWSTDPPGYYFGPWQHGYAHHTGLPRSSCSLGRRHGQRSGMSHEAQLLGDIPANQTAEDAYVPTGLPSLWATEPRARAASLAADRNRRARAVVLSRR
jgi:hypothetical protein